VRPVNPNRSASSARFTVKNVDIPVDSHRPRHVEAGAKTSSFLREPPSELTAESNTSVGISPNFNLATFRASHTQRVTSWDRKAPWKN